MRSVRNLVATLGLALVVGLLPIAPQRSSAAPPTPPFGAAIEPYQSYVGQSVCDPVAKPGVAQFRDLVRRTYPVGAGNIERACDVGGQSEHKEGRAWDMPVRVDIASQKAIADDLLAWLLATDQYGNGHAMARRLGLMYVIWNGRIWKSYQASQGWQIYTGSNPHTDHIHFSFSWAGAWAQTSFFVPMANEFMAYARSFTGGVSSDAGNIVPGGDDEVVTGPGFGGGPHVRIFEADGAVVAEWMAYGGGFSGGVDVAVGDVNGDGTDEIITAAGPTGGPHVRVFDSGGRVLSEFMAYDPSFAGGVNVTTGDVNGDGKDEIVTGAGAGGSPHVRVVDRFGKSVSGFYAYSPSFHGGVDVAAEDVSGDGRAEIMTGPGPGGAPDVRAFWYDGRPISSFLAFAPQFTGGVSVATSKRWDNWTGLIVGAGPTGGPHVRVMSFTGDEQWGSFYAAPANLATGLGVAGGQFGGGNGEVLVTGKRGALPFVAVYSFSGQDVPGVLDP